MPNGPLPRRFSAWKALGMAVAIPILSGVLDSVARSGPGRDIIGWLILPGIGGVGAYVLWYAVQTLKAIEKEGAGSRTRIVRFLAALLAGLIGLLSVLYIAIMVLFLFTGPIVS